MVGVVGKEKKEGTGSKSNHLGVEGSIGGVGVLAVRQGIGVLAVLQLVCKKHWIFTTAQVSASRTMHVEPSTTRIRLIEPSITLFVMQYKSTIAPNCCPQPYTVRKH